MEGALTLSTSVSNNGNNPDKSATEKPKRADNFIKKPQSHKKGLENITASTDVKWVNTDMDNQYLGDNGGSPRPTETVPSHDLAWKRHEDELVETKAEAEFYLDLMSHDIRNLTQIGVGYIELALETPDAGRDKIVAGKSCRKRCRAPPTSSITCESCRKQGKGKQRKQR